MPNSFLSSLMLSTTNEDLSLPSLNVLGSISVSINNGDLSFERLAVEDSLQLDAKNGDITGTVVGSYDDYAMSSHAKKGENNLPELKEGGEKRLSVQTNNGDIQIDFEAEHP
ncbi:DUF4097 family beta strand repeat protein [Massilimaliae timonensis]|uniref:DUF4097 family beta strand repeat protein n=1 Tax=Massiliimalia timonensis TaxID=1987501 RepID=A0A8J6P1M3_9FIRM|nr:DUF4097 family beta strand repeat-containing protein [Massiliimalia timonensis]MBC8611104.1 DUF4097 family beta strand repeat protein [Massiliimalia timonensis]MBS7176295.1 DUF4097 family beta strand repeat protein [Clostridiales bacterium]